jgi:hypothetical protein
MIARCGIEDSAAGTPNPPTGKTEKPWVKRFFRNITVALLREAGIATRSNPLERTHDDQPHNIVVHP